MRKVHICEMVARDGMQVMNRANKIPLQMRLDLVQRLQQANFPYIEVGSFVSRGQFPQLEDTPKLLESLTPYHGKLAALVPNLKYYERFENTANLQVLALFTSTSDIYNKKNKRVTVAEDLKDARRICDAARGHGHGVRVHLSAAFRDLTPVNGPTSPQAVVDICGQLFEMGCELVALADTDGRAFPTDIGRVLSPVLKSMDADRIGMHLHDRYGQAIANAYVAYDMGISTFDGSVGGIGGNKAIPGTVGNVSTEKLCLFFSGIGADTGIDLQALRRSLELVCEMAKMVGDPPPPAEYLLQELLAEETHSYELLKASMANIPETFNPREHVGERIKQLVASVPKTK